MTILTQLFAQKGSLMAILCNTYFDYVAIFFLLSVWLPRKIWCNGVEDELLF